MSSRAHKHAKKSSKPRKSQSPSPVHSSDSEPDIEQDEDQLLHRYQPTSPAQWSHHRHSTTSSVNGRLLPQSPQSAKANGSPAAQASPARRAPIDGLPPELLIHIFRQITDISVLHACLLVSPTWCQCAVELLWLKPQLASPEGLLSFLQVIQPGFNPDAPDINGERTFDSREVVVNGKGQTPENIDANNKGKVVQLDPHFPYPRFVRRLNLSSVADEVHDVHFRCLVACIRMERLTLTGCVHLTDASLSILSNMPNLVALDLTGVIDVTDKTILVVASSAPKLQGINLEGCKKITDVGVTAISHSCPLLRRIKLCELDQITGASVSVLVQKCPLLIEVDLTGCIGISEVSVRDIWSNCAQLRELRLASCTHIGDSAFPIPPRVSPSPPTFNPTVTTTMFPAAHQPQAASTNANDVTFRFVPGALPPLTLSKPLSHLRQLDLMSLRITDDAVAGVIANAPRLRYLVLAKCTALTDYSVRSIAELGKSLQFLHLGHANAITDAGIKTLARSCVRLRYVDLACCTSLTNESVRALCALPKLRRIGLVRVLNLTDDAVEHLTARYNTLERVHLSYCEKITVGAIHHLLQRLTKLTHLSLTGVPAFRRKDLQKFCRPAPPNFNETQRDAFCVYSGSGIHLLRKHLESIAPKLEEDNVHPAEDDNDPDLSNLHFGNGNSRGDNHASESDDENQDDPTSSPPQANSAPHSTHRSHQHGRVGNDWLWISRSPATPGSSRANRGAPSSSSTPAPIAFAGMSTQGSTSSANGIRHRNLAGNVANPVVGARMQAWLQNSNGPSSSATGSSPVATTTASNGGRWVVPLPANGPIEPQGRENSLAVPFLHSMTRSRSGGGSTRQASEIPVTRSSSSNGRRRVTPSPSASPPSSSAIDQSPSLSGLSANEPTAAAAEPNQTADASREGGMDADESNTRTRRTNDSSSRPSSERRTKTSKRDRERDRDREGGTRTPVPTVDNEGSRATTPSPSPGVMSPSNGTPNGKAKRGLKSTLSAAEQFTVSLFKGKGRSRENSASSGSSPGPGGGAGHGSG